MRTFAALCALCATLALGNLAHAQIFNLEGLWPQQDGASWTFQGTLDQYEMPSESFTARLIIDGTVDLAGGITAFNVIGRIDGLTAAPDDGTPAGLPSLLRTLWTLRPELRSELESRYAHALRVPAQAPEWPLELLQPAEAANGLGLYTSATALGSWRDAIAGWSWWYVTDALSVGSEWTLQLIPDIANDVFLHGRVVDQFTQIDVGGQTFTNVLVMEYRVDFGELTISDESGQLIGTARAETTGRISFGMDVGPLRMFEDHRFTEVSCPNGCPEEELVGVVLRHGSLELTAGPVAAATESWGAVKSRF